MNGISIGDILRVRDGEPHGGMELKVSAIGGMISGYIEEAGNSYAYREDRLEGLPVTKKILASHGFKFEKGDNDESLMVLFVDGEPFEHKGIKFPSYYRVEVEFARGTETVRRVSVRSFNGHGVFKCEVNPSDGIMLHEIQHLMRDCKCKGT